MSFDSPNLQVFTPSSSGRSSPVPRSARNLAEEALYKKDKTFRRYASNVERALALWDAAQQEWADYISFLARLLKALQSHPPEVSVIAHSDVVALRLAQCLTPALPSGVHQKALEVYDYVFATVGKDVLARDIHIYFPGLASVLSFASLSVRPYFLAIFENYFLKLDGAALRPALKAVILALLPGLEDETSEDFERVVAAVEKLQTNSQEILAEGITGTVSGEPSYFWQCFFLAAITNSSRRQGALAFLVRRLPRFGVIRRLPTPSKVFESTASLSPEAEAAISPEPGLLIRCFETGLSDPQLLIQRGFLDLLVSHLPLDSIVLQERIDKKDFERLVAAAANVVSRRDMSLNRRLWAWFLGPEPTDMEGSESFSSPTMDKPRQSINASSHQAAYFSRYGLDSLTKSVLKMINQRSAVPVARARPFRVCLSLMDRWEVGGMVVPDVFLPALRSIQSYSATASKEHVEEVMRSASAFFDGVDSGLIWGKLIQLVKSAIQCDIKQHEEAIQQLRLAEFVLMRFNVKEEEMLVYHMPLMIVSMLVSLNETTSSTDELEISRLISQITAFVVQSIPDRAFKREKVSESDLTSATQMSRLIIQQRIQVFYEQGQGSIEATDLPFSPSQIGQLALREASKLFVTAIRFGKSVSSVETAAKLLINLIAKTGNLRAIDEGNLVEVMHQALRVTENRKASIPFSLLKSISDVLVALQTSTQAEPYISPSHLSELIYPLIHRFWEYLSPTMPKYHVESSRCMLQLDMIAPSRRIVEAAISSIIVKEDELHSRTSASSISADCGRHFAVLWTHIMYELGAQSEKRSSAFRRTGSAVAHFSYLSSNEFHAILTRPLFLFLDTLSAESSEVSLFMRSWLHGLPSLNRVFEVLIRHLQSLHCLTKKSKLAPGSTPQKLETTRRRDDSKECLYLLTRIHTILDHPSQFMWMTLAESSIASDEDSTIRTTIQQWLVETCLDTLSFEQGSLQHGPNAYIHELHHISVSILSQMYQSPFASSLQELELEVPLMGRLKTARPTLQILLLKAGLSALRLRASHAAVASRVESSIPSHPSHPIHRTRMSLTGHPVVDEAAIESAKPPPELFEHLKHGFSSLNSRAVLDDWVHFLVEVLSLFTESVFQNLLPLVECLCQQIIQTFEHLKLVFLKDESAPSMSPESTLISLINALEQILAKAHERLIEQETRTSAAKTPEAPQGFFSNVVSGVFSSEINQNRTPTANSRLTVLLCFQDTVRICFSIWSWGGQGQYNSSSGSSIAYTSLRMRNRARRMLEHLFTAEMLECLETLVVLWTQAKRTDVPGAGVLGLLNVLHGSKPKHTIPAIFNAVCSRTDPGALDAHRLSSLTSDLSDADLVTFLVDYTQSLEDDAMDEIWQDCTLFLKDVLGNPLAHRQILPTLLEFTAVIGQKVDNTTFGEQKRMRKDLADIFARLLTAVFTTRSMGYLQDANQILSSKDPTAITNGDRARSRATDVVSILHSVVPKLSIILVENDRVIKVVSDISTNVINPTFRAKAFPENVSTRMLELVFGLTKIAQGNKLLKKDIYDAFHDVKFFSTPPTLLRDSWLPILAQWTQSDKEKMTELLSKLSVPTTAGIMFGVGATSARHEADRKTQLTLRRMALLILASAEDAFTPELPQVLGKIVELLTATTASSPSSVTRAEVVILVRAIILQTSPVHLASLWPIVNGELTSSLSSLLPSAGSKDVYNSAGLMQMCKLLDELVVLDPDDFQLIEWLFITDSIDAVYKPSTSLTLLSLTDEINEVLSHTESAPASVPQGSDHVDMDESKRYLFLTPLITTVEKQQGAAVVDMTKAELVDRIIKPFLGNLSMNAFESRYRGGTPDRQAIWESVVKDAGS